MQGLTLPHIRSATPRAVRTGSGGGGETGRQRSGVTEAWSGTEACSRHGGPLSKGLRSPVPRGSGHLYIYSRLIEDAQIPRSATGVLVPGLRRGEVLGQGSGRERPTK